MNKSFLAFSLSVACAATVVAQQAETKATGQAATQSSAATKNVSLDAGTQIAGELQNSINVRKAKVGDQVLLKTTKAIKSGGRTVVGKGAKLIGHVTEVAKRTKDNGESRIGLLFDRLEQGTLDFPIAATITSITNVGGNARTNTDDGFADMSAGSSSRSTASTSSSSGGGLLGGVGNTVGTVVAGTTSTVGSTVNSTASAAGNPVSGVGQLSGIQISQSSNTSVQGGSTLSLQGGDLRLEKGANFNLVLTQSANAGTNKQE